MSTTIQNHLSTRTPPVLSMHAEARVLERTSLTRIELLDAIRIQHSPRIGHSRNRSNLTYLLVWDYLAKNYVVAVQDIVCGTILTVLTMDLYLSQHHGPKIAETIIQDFEERLDSEYPGDFPWVSARGSKRIAVSVQTGCEATRKYLGTWSSRSYLQCPSDAGKDKRFWVWVIQRSQNIGINILSLECVYGRIGEDPAEVVPYSYQKPVHHIDQEVTSNDNPY